jgi:hypothetical protein
MRAAGRGQKCLKMGYFKEQISDNRPISQYPDTAN